MVRGGRKRQHLGVPFKARLGGRAAAAAGRRAGTAGGVGRAGAQPGGGLCLGGREVRGNPCGEPRCTAAPGAAGCSWGPLRAALGNAAEGRAGGGGGDRAQRLVLAAVRRGLLRSQRPGWWCPRWGEESRGLRGLRSSRGALPDPAAR